MSSNSSTCQDYKSALPYSLWPNILTSFPFTEENRMTSPFPGHSDFLDSFTADDSEKVYVHPMEKRSYYSLSTKSLEMCTEGLGNETGCVFCSSMDEFSVIVLEKQSSVENKCPKTEKSSKKVDHSRCFPPPLSSISGRDVVRVQSHREGGRLVIKASSFSCCSTYFRAVRENGRLQLSMRKDESWDCEDSVAENGEVGAANGEEPAKDFDENCDSKLEDGGKVGCRIGGGEWCGSRCKGDDCKKLSSLPFCVAIS